MTKYINEVVDLIINDKTVIKATKYISPTSIVRAVRKLYGKKLLKGNTEITLTVGKPNYAEREFIKDCKEAGERFPVKKIQIKFYAYIQLSKNKNLKK